MKINCIAIDDEPLALDKIKLFVDKVPFLNLLKCYNNAIDAIGFLKTHHVDLMFLDIQMDDFTGIQLLETLYERPKVILTTAYDSYALQGYELDIADYLLKPISFERFLKAANKVYDGIYAETKDVNTHDHSIKQTVKDDFTFIKTEYRMQKVIFDNILFIEGMKDYLRVVTKNEKIMTLQSFKQMEQILPSNNFIRIHKSYLIAINKIDSIERNRVKIKDAVIPIGDNYKKQFLDILKNRGLL